jgi:hypothetical protein
LFLVAWSKTGKKIKLYGLYALSFAEPIDVIKVIDKESGSIIRIIWDYTNPENNFKEISDRTLISQGRIKRLFKIKSKYDAGEDVVAQIGHRKKRNHLPMSEYSN